MSMPTRADAIRTLEEGHRAIGELTGKLTDEQLTRPATIGGGDWSAKDLIGHIASWEGYTLEALQEWRRGERPWVEDVFTNAETDRVNDEAVERSHPISLEEIQARAEQHHHDLVAAIASLADEEWTSKAPYATKRRTTLAALLGSVTGAPKQPFGHAFAHLPDLEAYVASVRTSA